MKDVFEGLRDIPEPPLRPVVEVLTAARRKKRRRTVLGAAAGSLAALAMLAGWSLAVDRSDPPAPLPQAAAPSPSLAIPPVPAAEVVKEHASQIARALIGAVPAGYAAASVKLAGDTEPAEKYKTRVSINKGGYRAVTLVRITAAKRSGVVAAVFGTDLPAPQAGADLCAAHRDLAIEGATITGCRMVDIGGTGVRVVSGTDPGIGRVLSATRYLDGGYVVVSVSQGVRTYRLSPVGDTWIWEVAVNPRNEKALAEMPLSADRLAALAADPALLP